MSDDTDAWRERGYEIAVEACYGDGTMAALAVDALIAAGWRPLEEHDRAD